MKTNSLLRWGILGLALVTCLTPLVVANGFFFPFITGKAFVFRFVVEAMLALWLVLALRDPSARPKRSFLLYAAGAFLLSLLVSVFLSANPDKSFWSNFERMEGWIGIAHVVAYFLVIFSAFNAERFWKWLWNGTIAVSVVEALYGVGQLFGWLQIHQGGVRLDGTFGNATYLAIYMVMAFFMTALAWLWWAKGKDRWLQAGYGIAAVLQLVMVFYTATRGAILGLVVGAFVAGLVLLFSHGRGKALGRWGIGAVAVLVLAYAAFLAVDQTPFVQNHEVLSRLASVDTPQKLLEQGSTRFAIWEMAGKGFLERPVFGWGQESFNYVFNKFYDPSLYNQEQWFDRAHNEFLDWLVAGGAVGLALWLSLFGAALWYLFRKGNAFDAAERSIFAGLLAAYAVNDLFVFDNLMSYVLFFTVLAYIAYRASPAEASAKAGGGHVSSPIGGNAPVAKETANIAAPIIAVVFCLVAYLANVPGMRASTDLIQSLSSHPEGVSANLAYFKQAVADAGNGGLGLQEIREQLVQFAIQVKQVNAGDAAFQGAVRELATQEMRSQIATSPDDARLRLFLGTYLLQAGDVAGAKAEFAAARESSPGKQQILIELGAADAAAGDFPSALQWFKQAYDSAPGYDTARVTYAAGAIEAGDKALASSLLLPRFGTVTPDDPTILQAYLAAKDYENALAIVRGRAAANPGSAQPHQQLAAVYLQEGDNADAIIELQKAIQLDPSFAAQGNYYIQQIQSGAGK